MKKYDIVINKLIEMIDEMIDSGVAPWRATWLQKQMNGITMKPYRGFNVFTLSYNQYIYGYQSPIWLTWKQIMQLGGTVKKGSKTAIVFFASLIEKKDEESKDNKEIEEEQNKSYFLWRYYRIFNLDCVEGIDKSRWLRSHLDLKNPKTIINEWSKICPIKHGSTKAYYIPDIDKIVVPHKNVFDTIEDYYATVFHEIVHSTGHKSRLNRPLSMIKEEYSFEELIAEIGSAFLCVETGIEPNYENSASYLRGWSNYFKNNRKQTILQACSQAQKAVEYIASRP